MTWSLLFFTTNIFLGIGLAMDAFSVSMANGLNEPHMNKGRVCTIAGVFGGFQALMPLIGWFCVHTIAESFHVFEKFIPWIALILLLFIGGKMLIEGIKNDCEEEVSAVSPGALFVQGIATSIDALSVGFTIAEYNWIMALAASLIIAIVTFFICIGAVSYTHLDVYKRQVAFCCELAENSSNSSLVKCHCSATFSAVIPIWY